MSRRADESEQEYEARLTMERQRSAAQERSSRVTEIDREQQQQLHWMRCPKCGWELSEVQFRDVKLDKCFACAGVFLDDGELEQLTGKPGWFDSMLQFFRG